MTKETHLKERRSRPATKRKIHEYHRHCKKKMRSIDRIFTRFKKKSKGFISLLDILISLLFRSNTLLIRLINNDNNNRHNHKL
jgi:hypothetical protein